MYSEHDRNVSASAYVAFLVNEICKNIAHRFVTLLIYVFAMICIVQRKTFPLRIIQLSSI
jgi:hypothetical protein